MLAFARETRLSETTFVQTADVAGADYRSRIWMVRGEVPFAGHPSLGTAVAVALARGEQDRLATSSRRGRGCSAVDVRLTGSTSARASMLQEPAVFGPELDLGRVFARARARSRPARPRAAAAGRLDRARRRSSCPCGARRSTSCAPTSPPARALIGEHAAVTLYVAAVDGAVARARARLSSTSTAVGEDPATGSAAGPLMAYLHERTGVDRLRIEQGVEMGRASVLECAVEGDRVRVGGDVVVVARGHRLAVAGHASTRRARGVQKQAVAVDFRGRRTRAGVGEQPSRDLPPGGQGRIAEAPRGRVPRGALAF